MKLIFIFCFCLIYTFVRYAYFGTVEAAHWPAFLLNKTISFYAVTILCWSAWCYQQRKLEQSKQMGRIVWHAVIIHIGLSLTLVSADYYQKLFSDNGFNLNGEIIMLLGVLAAYSFWQIPKFAHNLAYQHRIKLAACLFALGHIIPLGSSWFEPTTWYGNMPPISLLSAACCLLAFAFTSAKQVTATQT